jgi:salicylate hydroxylase
VVVVGAGLGGLGAAIAILLAGHDVLVLESTSEIAEVLFSNPSQVSQLRQDQVGAGIQILPNSSRVLQSWGMRTALSQHATRPKQINMIGWKGNLISSMDFHDSAAQYPGTFYWDFHRASLHKCLLDRAVELGATVRCSSRVVDVRVSENGERASVFLERDVEIEADLVVGADGINSKLREVMLGREDPPAPTGDLAYRLLLSTSEMMKDPELASLVTDPQVNYWLGPDMHAVNYVLKGGKLFNMVLLVPDDMPAGASTLEGNVEEMRALYKIGIQGYPSFWVCVSRFISGGFASVTEWIIGVIRLEPSPSLEMLCTLLYRI